MAIAKELTDRQKFLIKKSIIRMQAQGLKFPAIKQRIFKAYNVTLFDDSKTNG